MPRTLPPVDDDIFEALQALAEPLVDDINSVLRRVLGLQPSSTNGSFAAKLPVPAEAAVVSASRKRQSGGKTSVSKSKARSKQPRAARGTLLPEAEYEVPILQALHDLGGRGPASEVVENVGKRLGDRLQPADHEQLGSGDIRWKNRVQFVRLKLVRSGDMEKDAPRGVWGITGQGMARLNGNL